MLLLTWPCDLPRQQCCVFFSSLCFISLFPHLLQLEWALRDLWVTEIALSVLLKHWTLLNSIEAFLSNNIFRRFAAFCYGCLIWANCCLIWKRGWSISLDCITQRWKKEQSRKNKNFWKTLVCKWAELNKKCLFLITTYKCMTSSISEKTPCLVE